MKKILTNDIFLNFLNRTSVRDYEKTDLDQNFITQIEQIINASPTSLNGHAFSAILINDQNIKNQLANLNKYQKQIADCGLFVVFLVDNFALEFCQIKTNKIVEQYFNNEILLTSTVDATIAATMVQDFAISNGYGTCFIGALRYNIKKVQDILNLNENIIPILGLCIGKIAKTNSVKPKLNKVMYNSYDKRKLVNSIEKYNNTMLDYYATRGIHDNFVEHTINHYLKNNTITNSKQLDELNNIIENYWFKKEDNKNE